MLDVDARNNIKMKIKIQYGDTIFTIILMMLIFIGFNTYKDYGISWDESISRDNGFVSLKYIISYFHLKTNFNNIYPNVIDLYNYKDYDYPSIFEILCAFLEWKLQIFDSKTIYEMRHLLTFMCWIVGVVFLYMTLRLRFRSLLICNTAILLYVLHPRLYGEAFYNDKDIVFMSFFAVALFFIVNLMMRLTYINAIFAGVAIAVAINVRVMAVILPIILIAYIILIAIRSNSPLRTLAIACCTVLVTVGVTILLWPFLWENPVENFLQSFMNMARFRWSGHVLVNGTNLISTDLPWYYALMWMGVTTPLVSVFFICLGAVYIIAIPAVKILTLNQRETDILDTFFLSVPVAVILSIIVLNSVLYDGWRQLYFIYPSLVLVSAVGLDQAATIFGKLGYSKAAIYSVVYVLVFQTIITMVQMHPLQNVYFNDLTTAEDRMNRWEIDYWGLANKMALNYILTYDDASQITISAGSKTPLRESLKLLEPNERNRLKIQDELCLSDYVITNFRQVNGAKHDQYGHEFRLIWEKTVENMPVFRIYKRNAITDMKCPSEYQMKESSDTLL
jgi:hypothetical protein